MFWKTFDFTALADRAMVIVDTSVWIDYFAGSATPQAEWVSQENGFVAMGLTELILCEILQGTRGEPKFLSVRLELSAFDVFESGSERLSVASARNYRLLRSKGITVRNTIDCLIATFCIAEGHTLLHNDRDFDPFEEHLGLQVLHPSSH